MNLSYLMGGDAITDSELEIHGIKVKGVSNSGSRMLEIPEESLSGYKKLIKEKLNKDYWNEIIGPKEIYFIFKFKDTHIEEYSLSPETEQRIDKLCAEFNDEPPEKTANVHKYLSENDFYHDFMLEHYSKLINR